MASGTDSSSNSGSSDPYSLLGMEANASFEEVKKARDRKLLEVGEDPQARAKVEAAYDSLLMASLKDRQLGKVSNAAVSASEREESNLETAGESSLLTRLKSFKLPNKESSDNVFLPYLALPEGQGLTIRISLGLLALILIFISPKENIQIILSLSTLGLFISQVRRGRKPLASLGWSVVLLSSGLILGGLLVNGSHDTTIATIPITKEQLEALPAVVLVWLGALFLD